MTTEAGFRTGFVALLGQPNVGKSTLVNALSGEQVAIVTPKPQTTRTCVRGILNRGDGQVVLVDTPGMCQTGTALHRSLRRAAVTAAAGADLALVVMACREGGESAPLSPQDHEVLAAARKAAQRRIVVALNKIDRVPAKHTLLARMATLAEVSDIHAVVPISAKEGDGLDELLRVIIALLPEGEPLFPPDLYTDQAERFICAELVREQLLLRLQDEVPHCVAVVIDSFKDTRDQESRPFVSLQGRILVEREAQKGIVVGKHGAQIKAISTAARRRIEGFLGVSVFLRLEVRVEHHWTRSVGMMRRYGIGGEV